MPSTRALRILLVDDHPLFLEGLHNLLSTAGYTVVGAARDGIEALAQARRLHPDVILMDIQMPRCDGLSATRLIKAEMPECRVVMLTVSADQDDLFEAIKSGASGYLLKDLQAGELFAYLSELQSGHAPFSPGLADRILREFALQAAPTPPGTGEDLPPAPAAALSARQVQVLTLVAQGKTYREVAAIIGLSERTVKYHMAEVLDRLHLDNRAQVIAYVARYWPGRGPETL